ncbi:uncharacterized protein, partial [Temnothorax longispinosus]|uniref:uncharacterized protein n=1 Tax=Temnothorax longispinosus TaxID=300112 RepID=UPI003A9A55D4
ASALLLPAVTITCKPHNLASNNQNNNNTDIKVLSANNQIGEKGKGGQNYTGGKNRTSKLPVRVTSTTVNNKNAALHSIATSGSSIAAGKINSSMKKHDGNNDSRKSSSESHNTTKTGSIVTAKQSSSSTFSSVRPVSTFITSTAHENPMKNPKDYTAPKKFPNETNSGIKNYTIQLDYKEPMSVNSPDYKSIAGSMTANLPLRFATQQSIPTPILHRETYTPSSTYSPQSASCQRNDNSAFAIARKALEQQQSSMPKMAPINFPPLRAPQSIVNVRHPLLTDARIKHGSETIGGGGISGGGAVGLKSKLNIMSSLQSGVKDLADHTGRSQTAFHGYGTSPIAAGIPSVQNLNSAVTANISPYPRPEAFPQPTVANVLFPETAAQFPQSPPFNTTPIGQLNQYQTYDPGSYPTTPVNVNTVIPQFSAESSIPYPQYENPPQFVQPSHYPTADMANSQYQYQAAAAAAAAAGVGQIQDSSIFIQSLQSTIAVTDQYATPNYARTVRTELITRLRRPPRFNK